MSRRPLVLGAAYHGVGGPGQYRLWTNPELAPDAGVRLDKYLEWAALAEEARFDFFFLADSVLISPDSPPHYLNRLEPITALAALAGVTHNIGLVATITTTYNPPFNIARSLATVDLLSGGRAGINLVTSTDEDTARLYGVAQHPLHAERYAQAAEFIEVVQQLWGTYEPGAFPYDRERGVILDPTKVYPVNHHGRFFDVEGALNVQRSPQGEPVVFQAGLSPEGRELGARHAEAIFSFPLEWDEQRQLLATYRARAAELGRKAPLLLPGIAPIIADSEADAREIERIRHDEKPFEDRLRAFGRTFAWHDFGSYDPDDAFPDLTGHDWRAHPAIARQIIETAAAEGLSLRETVLRFTPLRTSPFVGTAEHIADLLIEWQDADALDGAILVQNLPSDFRAFNEGVVPILQDRGRFRREYEASTLRGLLGIDVPEPQHQPGAVPWRAESGQRLHAGVE